MTGVRHRETGFEGRCEYCREWWPLTEDFWQLNATGSSMRKCLACIRESKRAHQRRRMADPVLREKNRLGVYEQRKLMKELGLMGEYRHRWYMSKREEICRKRREKYAADQLAKGRVIKPRGPQ